MRFAIECSADADTTPICRYAVDGLLTYAAHACARHASPELAQGMVVRIEDFASSRMAFDLRNHLLGCMIRDQQRIDYRLDHSSRRQIDPGARVEHEAAARGQIRHARTGPLRFRTAPEFLSTPACPRPRGHTAGFRQQFTLEGDRRQIGEARLYGRRLGMHGDLADHAALQVAGKAPILHRARRPLRQQSEFLEPSAHGF